MNARRVAMSVLLKSEKTNQYSNIAIDHALSSSGLSAADRALVSAIVYGVTERRLTLDYYISRLSSRPFASIDAEPLCALRIGMYQLIYMDKIPPHAAVNETVALCRRSYSGFVNALLRSYMRLSSPIELPDADISPAEHLSVAYSVCTPLAEKFISTFGFDRAKSILAATFDTPKTTLRVNTLKISRENLAPHIDGAIASELSPVGLKVTGSVRELYGFDEGLFFVQDEASQICVGALGAKSGELVIDACACPGSKSFGAAIDMKNTGKLLSFDLHKSKLSLISSGAQRLGIDIISADVCDGRIFLPHLEGKADRVLCDVPCSGFGVLAKKPELRYKDPAQSEALPDIQLAILSNCSRYVKAGGTLVYSTCTIFPEENEENVKRFLASHPEFSLCGFEFGAIDCPSGMLSLYGDTHRTDGFFVARMIRSK